MPGKVKKYSRQDDGELKMRVLAVLDNASEYDTPTLEWIQKQDIILAPHTTQKLSRVLASLVELGLVKKGKSKSMNKMVYRLTSKMLEDGYNEEEIEVSIYPRMAYAGKEIEDGKEN